MHELWLCKHIMGIVNQHLAGRPCKSIKKIYLEVGELVAVDKSSLVYCFNAVAHDTCANGAELDIINIPGRAICDICKKEVPVSHYATPCEYCGGFSLTITQGEELRVKSMEVE